MNFRKLFTVPVKTQNEYADQILSERISLKEVLNTAYFFFALIMVSPYYEMDSDGELHRRLRLRISSRVPPAIKWGKNPKYWF